MESGYRSAHETAKGEVGAEGIPVERVVITPRQTFVERVEPANTTTGSAPPAATGSATTGGVAATVRQEVREVHSVRAAEPAVTERRFYERAVATEPVVREQVVYREVVPEPASGRTVLLERVPPASILGLFALAGGAFVLGAQWGGWNFLTLFGSPTGLYLFPFLALVGGVAQLLAAWWAYRSQNGAATALHGLWGAFFLAYSWLLWLFTTGALLLPIGPFPGLAEWMVAMAALTLTISVGAVPRNFIHAGLDFLLCVAAALAAVALFVNGLWWLRISGWILVVAAVVAWYLGTAFLLEDSWGKPFLPTGQRHRWEKRYEDDERKEGSTWRRISLWPPTRRRVA